MSSSYDIKKNLSVNNYASMCMFRITGSIVKSEGRFDVAEDEGDQSSTAKRKRRILFWKLRVSVVLSSMGFVTLTERMVCGDLR
jgi:hypothetical protein